MDDDEIEFDPNDPGNIEVGRRLDAFAEARLSPSAEATARARTAVMTAAHRQAALRDAGAATTAAVASSAAAEAAESRPTRLWRRAAVAVAAVVLLVGVVAGATFGTDPGAPFYPTRVGVEAANLPGDLAARASAQVTRLEARIREAKRSTVAGDGPAVVAALTTYTAILTETEAGAHSDPRATPIIVVNLTRFIIDLDGLAGTIPAQAQPALADARTMSQAVLSRLTGGQ
jgi:hypothetical protein